MRFVALECDAVERFCFPVPRYSLLDVEYRRLGIALQKRTPHFVQGRVVCEHNRAKAEDCELVRNFQRGEWCEGFALAEIGPQDDSGMTGG
jgi:hypothetical protein